MGSQSGRYIIYIYIIYALQTMKYLIFKWWTDITMPLERSLKGIRVQHMYVHSPTGSIIVLSSFGSTLLFMNEI